MTDLLFGAVGRVNLGVSVLHMLVRWRALLRSALLETITIFQSRFLWVESEVWFRNLIQSLFSLSTILTADTVPGGAVLSEDSRSKALKYGDGPIQLRTTGRNSRPWNKP